MTNIACDFTHEQVQVEEKSKEKGKDPEKEIMWAGKKKVEQWNSSVVANHFITLALICVNIMCIHVLINLYFYWALTSFFLCITMGWLVI